MARLRLLVCVALFALVAVLCPGPVTAFPDPPRGCCVLGGFEGKCQRTEAECMALGGAWHEGVTCAAQAAYEAPYFDGGAGDPVGCAMDSFGTDTDSDGVLDADDACPTVPWDSGGDGTNGDGCPCKLVRRWDWNGSEWVLEELPPGWSYCLPCANPGPPAAPDGLEGRGGGTQYWNCEGCYSGCDRGCCADAESGTLSCNTEEPACRGASETFTFGDLECADAHADLPEYDWCGASDGGDGDNDGDGIPNGEDSDVDGDGVPNGDDPDVDGDGIPNGEDGDVNDDGESNAEDTDIDGDGVENQEDDDMDGDGQGNDSDTDNDGDGIQDEDDSTPDGVGSGGGIIGTHPPCCLTAAQVEERGLTDSGDMDSDGVPDAEDECPLCRWDCIEKQMYEGNWKSSGIPFASTYMDREVTFPWSTGCVCVGCPEIWQYELRGYGDSRDAWDDRDYDPTEDNVWQAYLHSRTPHSKRQMGCDADTDWDEDGINNEDDPDCPSTCDGCTYCGQLANKFLEAWTATNERFKLEKIGADIAALWVAPPCECEEGEDPEECEERCAEVEAAFNKIPVFTIPLPSSVLGYPMPQSSITVNLRPYFDERTSPFAAYLTNGFWLFRKCVLALFVFMLVPRFITAIKG